MIVLRLLMVILIYAVGIGILMLGWGLTPQNWYVIIVGYCVIVILGIVNEFLKENLRW